MRPGPRGPGNPNVYTLIVNADAASMRPGPCGPGNWIESDKARTRRRCFNEAGAARPRKYRPRKPDRTMTQKASMRPGPRGPGNRRARITRIRSYKASMRPGPRGPGNLPPPPAHRPHTSASMRPGPRGPGNPSCRRFPSQARNASMRPGPRGPGNVDGTCVYDRSSRCFNEAGAARPRKSFTDCIKNSIRVPLQ